MVKEIKKSGMISLEEAVQLVEGIPLELFHKKNEKGKTEVSRFSVSYEGLNVTFEKKTKEVEYQGPWHKYNSYDIFYNLKISQRRKLIGLFGGYYKDTEGAPHKDLVEMNRVVSKGFWRLGEVYTYLKPL